MKIFLFLTTLFLGYSAFADQFEGPCARAAARAAGIFAAKNWGADSKNQRVVVFSVQERTSNRPPIQVYNVCIMREDKVAVYFDVGLEYVDEKCINLYPQFSEFAQ